VLVRLCYKSGRFPFWNNFFFYTF